MYTPAGAACRCCACSTRARLLQSQLKGQSAADPDLQYDRFMSAMAAAHVPAVQAITADPLVASQLFRSPADAADLANSLCIAVACGPGTLALEPELQLSLVQALRCAPKERRAAAAAVWELLMVAENSTRLATALLLSGGLGLIVNWLHHALLASGGADYLLFSVGVLLLNALEAVRRGGRLLAEAVEGGSPVSPTVAAVLAACPPVEQAFVAARGGQGED